MLWATNAIAANSITPATMPPIRPTAKRDRRIPLTPIVVVSVLSLLLLAATVYFSLRETCLGPTHLSRLQAVLQKVGLMTHSWPRSIRFRPRCPT